LWLEIEGKHVVFPELWLGRTSLELWLEMTDEHEKSLSCGLDWWVCQRECTSSSSYGWI